jgi:hypothetical protein
VIFDPVGRLGGWMSAGSVVEGNYAYLGIGPYLNILDISDPAGIYETGYLSLSYIYGIDHIEKSGAYVFASSPQILYVINVENVNLPILAGAYEVPENDPAHAMTYAGNYVYLGCTNGVRVIDISDPANPQLVGIYANFIGISDMAIAGQYAYLAVNSHGLGEDGLAILDVSNPISPTLVSLATPQFPASNLAIAGNYAYVTEADPGSGLHIFDITDPYHPAEAGSCDCAEGGLTYDIAIKNQVAYTVYNNYSLLMIDLSDPTQPAAIGEYYPFTGTMIKLTIKMLMCCRRAAFPSWMSPIQPTPHG